MADLSTGSVFVDGTTASASAANARFAAIETFMNATGVHIYQAATIETAALENNAVTHAKMDSKTMGQQVTSGYAQRTTSANTSSGTVNAVSITVTGDGATPMTIEGHCLAFGSASSGATTDVFLRLLDDTTKISEFIHDAVSASSYTGGYVKRTIPSFSGSKTFHLNLYVATGTAVLYAEVAAPAFIRATWAPGYLTS